MSATYPPESQQSPPQPPPEVRPPRKRHRVRKTMLIIGGALAALILVIVVISVAAGNKTAKAPRASAPSPSPSVVEQSYANANQIVQALKTHRVLVTNVVADSGFWSGEGATSGVWATTAPGDSAAIFGGSENPVQDTEIVVFQNHAKAVAYANLGTSPTSTPDSDHETILGTNWAVDAATPAAPSIRAALGGTLVVPNVPASSSASPSAPAAPATQAPATSAPAAPALTASQAQAVQAAQGYLALGTGFSYEGLLKQLTSSYGSGFSAADATFAINYLKPDWDQQAVEAAKGYLALGTGFSRDSLIQQLTSSDGSGFTQSQADYAVTQVGL
jgi:hypothetical protein